MKFLDSVLVLFIIFWGISIWVPLYIGMLHQLISPLTVHMCSILSTFSLTYFLFPFCYIIVRGTSWYLITVLSCITLMIRNVKHFFHLSIDHLYVFFGKMFCQTRPSAQFLKRASWKVVSQECLVPATLMYPALSTQCLSGPPQQESMALTS